jgi:phospho-N-acetylmuramoyl-pentapeptide-transferase
MIIPFESISLLRTALGYGLLACVVSFFWAPFLTTLLYRYNITRRGEFDATKSIQGKIGTPIMGGLLVIVTVACMTMLFNWEREFTWVPIGVMLMASALGGVDDLMNIFNTKKRRNRKLKHVLRLIRVHKDWKQRLWLTITLPWTLFKRSSLWLGSHPGRGLHVHERILFQFLAGAITAWWIYFKLGEHWQSIVVPFYGAFDLGMLIIPLIIFMVMATANAVNIADGMDGLAGGSLALSFLGLSILSWAEGYHAITILNATTLGALVTYTYFNIKPARFQMGDVGSLGLGALLAINAIVINQILLIPIIGFIFYLDLASVLIQLAGRYTLGRRIFTMAPLHHHFEFHGWSEEKTVMRFWVLQGVAVLLALFIALS